MTKMLLEGLQLVHVVSTDAQGVVVGDLQCHEFPLPEAEQVLDMPVGSRHPVYVYPNPLSGKWYASGRLSDWVQNQHHTLHKGQQVQIWTWYPSPLGWNVVVEGKYLGLMYHNEVFKHLQPGMDLIGYVQELREDHRIDIRLRTSGAGQQREDADQIFDILVNAGGFLPYSDHTGPEEIRNVFSMSKKAFKKALGTLYSTGKISLNDNGIQLK